MKEALKLALEALEWFTAAEQGDEPPINKAITVIKEALAQQEPVAWSDEQMIQFASMVLIQGRHHDSIEMRLNTFRSIMVERGTSHPPKRPWVGLTDEFCITEVIDVGQYSLQIIFKSRKNADEFKAANNIGVKP